MKSVTAFYIVLLITNILQFQYPPERKLHVTLHFFLDIEKSNA